MNGGIENGGAALYCEKCMTLFEGEKCPRCKSKKIKPRQPEAGDFVYLTEKSAIWVDVLEDALTQNGIIFAKKSTVGAGMALYIGTMNETFAYYVPFERYNEASALTDSVFNSPEDDGKSLTESDENAEADENDEQD